MDIYFIYCTEDIKKIKINGMCVEYFNNKIVIDKKLNEMFNLEDRFRKTFKIKDINDLSDKDFNTIKKINIKIVGGC